MAQLRQDQEKFLEKDVAIIVIGPEKTSAFQRYWNEHALPFIGLPDPKHSVLKLYGQEVKLFKWGRMPASEWRVARGEGRVQVWAWRLRSPRHRSISENSS